MKETQDFWNTINSPNLQIMGIEVGEYMQARSIENMYNKIVLESSSLWKDKVIKVQDGFRVPNRPEQKRNTSYHFILKTLSVLTRE
jgi:hypothetical protein